MLIANYSKDISNNAGHYKMGGGITNPYAVMKPSTLRNKWLGGNTNDQGVRDSINTGHNSPYVLVMGTKGWLLTSTNQSNGVASVNGNISSCVPFNSMSKPRLAVNKTFFRRSYSSFEITPCVFAASR